MQRKAITKYDNFLLLFVVIIFLWNILTYYWILSIFGYIYHILLK